MTFQIQCVGIETDKMENYDSQLRLREILHLMLLDTWFKQGSKMQELILGISLVGFSTMIGISLFNSRKNDSLIRNLCDRIAKLEGQLEIHFMNNEK
tara:strand:- start:722 stop:1012 length:291 start_codon:yes stop_codon:yes gene_type:complete